MKKHTQVQHPLWTAELILLRVTVKVIPPCIGWQVEGLHTGQDASLVVVRTYSRVNVNILKLYFSICVCGCVCASPGTQHNCKCPTWVRPEFGGKGRLSWMMCYSTFRHNRNWNTEEAKRERAEQLSVAKTVTKMQTLISKSEILG